MGCMWDVCGMGWYGMVRDGMGWYGMVWDGKGMVRGRYGMVWDGMGQIGLEKLSVLRKCD